MYKSPIKVTLDEPTYDLRDQGDAMIVKAVQNVNIDVDTEELIKALKYDRDQYEKGYRDAVDGIASLLGENVRAWLMEELQK